MSCTKWLLVGAIVLMVCIVLIIIVWPSNLLWGARAEPTNIPVPDPTVTEYLRYKENFIPRPYMVLQGKDFQYYSPNVSTFLNFAVKPNNAIDVANMFGGFYQSPTSSFAYNPAASYQLWTLPSAQFRQGREHSGVYRVTTAATTDACAQACDTDDYCHSFGYTANNQQCLHSALQPLPFLQQFHADLYSTSSPVQKSNEAENQVAFMLRNPVFLTSLKESQCTCNTLCGISGATKGLYTKGAGVALGTLDVDGLYCPSGDLSLPAAVTRTAFIKNNLFSFTNSLPEMKALLIDSQANKLTTPSMTLHEKYVKLGGRNRVKVCVCVNDPMGIPYPWITTPTLEQSYLACPVQLPNVTSNMTGFKPPVIGPPTYYINN